MIDVVVGLILTVTVMISGSVDLNEEPDCQVVYEYPVGYTRARIVKNDVIVEVIGGGGVPEGLTCENWDEKLYEIFGDSRNR